MSRSIISTTTARSIASWPPSIATWVRSTGRRSCAATTRSRARLAAEHGATTYGTSAGVDIRAVDVLASHGALTFAIERDGQHLVDIALPQRGMHNVRNATAALAMAIAVGVSPAVAATALAKFGGVARRFDIRGVDGGATFVDDYAHLPSEIAAVLDAARRSDDGWRRVVAVFQPNRYNRIAEIWADYGGSFGDADLVVLTDIYSSGTQPIPGVTGQLIVNAVVDHDPSHASGVAAEARRPRDVPGRRGPRRGRLHLDGVRRHRDAARRGARRATRERGPMMSRATARSRRRRGRGADRSGCPSRRATGAAHDLPRRRSGGAVRRGGDDRRSLPCRGGEGGERPAGTGDRSWLEHARGRFRVPGDRRVARRVRGRDRDRHGGRRRTSRRRGRRWRRAPGARPPDRGGVGRRVRVGGRRSRIGRRRGADERRWTRLRHGGGGDRCRRLRSGRRGGGRGDPAHRRDRPRPALPWVGPHRRPTRHRGPSRPPAR